MARVAVHAGLDRPALISLVVDGLLNDIRLGRASAANHNPLLTIRLRWTHAGSLFNAATAKQRASASS